MVSGDLRGTNGSVYRNEGGFKRIGTIREKRGQPDVNHTGVDGIITDKSTWIISGVAGKGHEQVRLAERSHNAYAVFKLLLLYVRGSSDETGGRRHRPSKSANIIIRPDNIDEAGVKSGAEFRW